MNVQNRSVRAMPRRPPETLIQRAQALVTILSDAAGEADASMVITSGTWRVDPATEIDEPPPHGVRADVSAWLSSKRAAIAAHASQMTDLIDDDPTCFRFDERTIAPFIGPYEYLFEVPA